MSPDDRTVYIDPDRTLLIPRPGARRGAPQPAPTTAPQSGNAATLQRLVAGMLDRDNLLDLIRTFTLFSTNDKGETIKIVGRYQQFRPHKHGCDFHPYN